MESDAIRVVVRQYVEAWAASDPEAWLSTFAEGATQEDPVGEGVLRGRHEIRTFWDRAMSSYDSVELRQRALHVVNSEAALEWTIVAADGEEWVAFDGVDVFTFDDVPLITSVRAYWESERRQRTRDYP